MNLRKQRPVRKTRHIILLYLKYNKQAKVIYAVRSPWFPLGERATRGEHKEA